MFKFVFDSGEVLRFHSFVDCVDSLNEYEDQLFDVYYYQIWNNEWILAFVHYPGVYCACGREYYDTPNGTLFAFRDVQLVYRNNMQKMLELLQTKPLCYYCFYAGEYKEGRFVPRSLRIDFERNNTYNE